MPKMLINGKWYTLQGAYRISPDGVLEMFSGIGKNGKTDLLELNFKEWEARQFHKKAIGFIASLGFKQFALAEKILWIVENVVFEDRSDLGYADSKGHVMVKGLFSVHAGNLDTEEA